MSHAEFVKTIKHKKTDNRFFISLLNTKTNEFEILKDEYYYCVIGRNPDCQIQLKNDKCSRNHCIIYFSNDTLNIRDLDSKIGTYYGKCAGTEVSNKQQLLPFTPMHIEEHDCIVIDSLVYKIEKINIANLNTDVPINIQPSKCQFCGQPVQLYIKELQNISQQISVLEHINNKTAAALTHEEQKVIDILKRLEQLSEAHKQFLKEQGEATKEATEPGVNFKSQVSIINDGNDEDDASGKKSAKSHKKTPYQRPAYDDDE